MLIFGHRYTLNSKGDSLGYSYDFESNTYNSLTKATMYDTDRYFYIDTEYAKYNSVYEGTVYAVDHSITIKKDGYYDILYTLDGVTKLAIKHQYLYKGVVYELDDTHGQITVIILCY